MRSRLRIAAGAMLVALLVAAPAAASALTVRTELSPDERAAGLWYADRMKFDQIREQGLTGKGVTIAVVDDAINLDAAELRGADIEVRGQYCENADTGESLPAISDDLNRSHGTSVVAMLVGNGVAADGGPGTLGIVPDAKILFYSADSKQVNKNGVTVCEAVDPDTGELQKDFTALPDDPMEAPITVGSAFAVSRAVEDGADIVSISSVASIWEGPVWALAEAQALRAGVPIVAGTSNPRMGRSVEEAMPYALNGVVAVGGVDNDGNVIRGQNTYGTDIEDAPGSKNLAFAAPGYEILAPAGNESWGPSLASGTSLATPLVAGVIALGIEKYPGTSAFQVLQAMIRTTGGEGISEPEWNGPTYGYGIVKPVAMLAVDPSQFPDENPLFVTSLTDPRCGSNASTFDECAWAIMMPLPDEVWPPNAVPGSVDTPSEGTGINAVLLLAAVFILLLLIAAVVTIVIVRSISRRASR